MISVIELRAGIAFLGGFWNTNMFIDPRTGEYVERTS